MLLWIDLCCRKNVRPTDEVVSAVTRALHPQTKICHGQCSKNLTAKSVRHIDKA